MTDAFTKSDLDQLFKTEQPHCVSIFMPTFRIDNDRLQNPIRLKNLLSDAEAQFTAQGVHPVAAREMLARARELLANETLLGDVAEGLALFCAGGELRYWRLPLAFEEFVWVGERFYLKPLLPLAAGDKPFYVLAVSQKDARLFQGTQSRLTEIHLNTLPTNLAEALHYHQPEGMFQVRTTSTFVHGKEGSVFHGQGAATQHPKDDILAYFRVIDRALHNYLKDQAVPLVFAGVVLARSSSGIFWGCFVRGGSG